MQKLYNVVRTFSLTLGEVCSNFILLFVGTSKWNWASILLNPKPLETTLLQVSDGRIPSCAELDLNVGDVQLRGQSAVQSGDQSATDYSSLLVTITMKTAIAFGPGPGQPTCHPIPSSLLAHHGSDCDQTFCDVPTTCRYLGDNTTSTPETYWHYDFICVCGQPVCNELVLWLRSGSVQGSFDRVTLCEVRTQRI